MPDPVDRRSELATALERLKTLIEEVPSARAAALLDELERRLAADALAPLSEQLGLRIASNGPGRVVAVDGADAKTALEPGEEHVFLPVRVRPAAPESDGASGDSPHPVSLLVVRLDPAGGDAVSVAVDPTGLARGAAGWGVMPLVLQRFDRNGRSAVETLSGNEELHLEPSGRAEIVGVGYRFGVPLPDVSRLFNRLEGDR